MKSIEAAGPTLIAVDNVCASACTIILFSFQNRYARLCDLIGVHRASVNGLENAASFEASTEIADYLIKSGLSWEIVRKMLETSSSQVAWLTQNDLDIANLTLIDTSCPRTDLKNNQAENAVNDYNLALAYIKGDGVDKDEKRGFSLAMQSARADNTDGEFLVGVLYANGIGVERDLPLAASWYKTAAMKGHPEAAFNLALLYKDGTGVPRDVGLAIKWYKAAASKKMASAALNLGLLYLDGSNGTIDKERGLLWLSIGGYLGDQNSTEQGARTARELSQAIVNKVGLAFEKCLSSNLLECDI
jgi:TPR repeat protein